MQMFVIIDKDGIMINVGVNVKCDKAFIWNPSNCECQCECHVMLENI